MHSSTWKLSELLDIKILCSLLHVSMINYYIHFYLFSSLQNSGSGGCWKFQASDQGLVFLLTSTHPEVHQELPYLNTYSHPLGNYKGFRSSVSGTGAQDQIWAGTSGRDKYFLLFHTPHGRFLTGCLISCNTQSSISPGSVNVPNPMLITLYILALFVLTEMLWKENHFYYKETKA